MVAHQGDDVTSPEPATRGFAWIPERDALALVFVFTGGVYLGQVSLELPGPQVRPRRKGREQVGQSGPLASPSPAQSRAGKRSLSPPRPPHTCPLVFHISHVGLFPLRRQWARS